jgi:hypothetical protein
VKKKLQTISVKKTRLKKRVLDEDEEGDDGYGVGHSSIKKRQKAEEDEDEDEDEGGGSAGASCLSHWHLGWSDSKFEPAWDRSWLE